MFNPSACNSKSGISPVPGISKVKSVKNYSIQNIFYWFISSIYGMIVQIYLYAKTFFKRSKMETSIKATRYNCGNRNIECFLNLV